QVPTAEQRRRADALRATIAELERSLQATARDDGQVRWEAGALESLGAPAPADALVHHYSFEEESGGAVGDLGADPHPGTLKPDDGNRRGPGRLGGAVRLDHGAFVECPGARACG